MYAPDADMEEGVYGGEDTVWHGPLTHKRAYMPTRRVETRLGGTGPAGYAGTVES